MLQGGSAVSADLSAPAAVIGWGLVLIVVLLVAGVGLQLAKKKSLARSRPGDEAGGGGFTLERLEAIHRRGQISDEEFSRLRRQVLESSVSGLSSRSSLPQGGDDGKVGGTDPNTEVGA